MNTKFDCRIWSNLTFKYQFDQIRPLGVRDRPNLTFSGLIFSQKDCFSAQLREVVYWSVLIFCTFWCIFGQNRPIFNFEFVIFGRIPNYFDSNSKFVRAKLLLQPHVRKNEGGGGNLPSPNKMVLKKFSLTHARP